MAQYQDKGKKPARQDWTPDWRLRALHKVWMTIFTAAKVALGAAITVLLIGVVCCFVLVGVLADYLETDILPTASLVLEDYVLDAPSYVYSVNSNGEIEKLQELYSSTDWKKAEYEDIPQALIHAAVAIEDKRFYEHQGVDWVTTIKAFANMFFGSETVGGSSITQQLIKNKTDEDSVTVQRKVLEFFRAALVEKNYDKDFIIEEYLNSIYMGQGCRGVKSAAEAYFGKELQTLTAAECASLISITNNPSLFDPYSDEEFTYEGELMNGKQRNRHRQMLVLGQMLVQGYITQEEYDAAVAQEMVFKSGVAEEDKWTICSNEECGYKGVRSTFKKEDDNVYCPKCNSVVTVATDGSQEVYSYFVDALLEDVARDMALQDGITNWNDSIWEDYMDRISRGGFHIYATIDTDVQAAVDKIYKDLDNIPDTKSAQQLQSAIVIIDNSTGDIVAMAGGVGDNKVHFGLNRATQSNLQSGSSIKPLTIYAPGFEQGTLTPATVIKDLPLTYDDDGPYPRNDDREYSYNRTIYSGIEDSVNAVAANTLQKIGLSYGFEFAKNTFGLSTLDETEDLQLAALALGAQYYGIKVRDMATAFAMFPNDGVYREGRLYTKVYDSKGNLILDNTQDSEERLSEKTAAYMNYCLKNAVEHGTGYQADFYSVDVAGKTGSTSSFRDRWFCGYTGYYTAAVWCGYDIPEPIYLSGASGNSAAMLWNKVMKQAHEGLSNKTLYDSSKMVKVNICMDTGLVATDACTNDVRGARVQEISLYPEDVPTATCNKHVLVDYCTACGCAANEYCLLMAERTDLVIEKKGLLKLTQKEINEILAAEKFGLHDIYTKDYYVYLINENGTDGSFKGFHGTVNQGVTSPYMVCTQHTKAVWDAFVAMYGPAVPEEPTTPDTTTPTTTPTTPPTTTP
ncbi:MAG: transglycosylase domain-containing protein [Oscillospiraceae bacterium]|nr:transglycosylase domain-containing protein [Oscillospiraceae bacterium]